MATGTKSQDGAAPRSPRSHTSRVVDDLGLAIVSGQQPEGSLLPGDVELVYVLEGTLELSVGDETHTLAE